MSIFALGQLCQGRPVLPLNHTLATILTVVNGNAKVESSTKAAAHTHSAFFCTGPIYLDGFVLVLGGRSVISIIRPEVTPAKDGS